MTLYRVQDKALVSVRRSLTVATVISVSRQKAKATAPPSGSGSLVRSAVVSTKGVSSNKSSKTLLRPFGSKRHPSGCRALSSEAGCPIIVIIRRTRFAQTAFRISLLRLLIAIRDSIMIQRIYIPLKTSSCGMFSRINPKKHEARSAVIGFAAWLV